MYGVFLSHPTPECRPKENGIWESLRCVPRCSGHKVASGSYLRNLKNKRQHLTAGLLASRDSAFGGNRNDFSVQLQTLREDGTGAGTGLNYTTGGRLLPLPAVGFQGPQRLLALACCTRPCQGGLCFEHLIKASSLADLEGCPRVTLRRPLPLAPPGAGPLIY